MLNKIETKIKNLEFLNDLVVNYSNYDDDVLDIGDLLGVLYDIIDDIVFILEQELNNYITIDIRHIILNKDSLKDLIEHQELSFIYKVMYGINDIDADYFIDWSFRTGINSDINNLYINDLSDVIDYLINEIKSYL